MEKLNWTLVFAITMQAGTCIYQLAYVKSHVEQLIEQVSAIRVEMSAFNASNVIYRLGELEEAVDVLSRKKHNES